jgi:hypothetical protein
MKQHWFGKKKTGLFGSVVVVVFQNVFHLKMYQNNFYFFKKIFLISAHQNNKKYIYKNNFKFLKFFWPILFGT